MKFFLNIFALTALAGQMNAQCPAISSCPASPVDVCDVTTNDPMLWNESYWLDNQTMLHDLADAPVDLSLSAVDTCVGGLQIRFELYLDLDGDGILETLLNSDSLAALGSGTVRFNNVSGGGALRDFDERPVATDQKYRFALEENGDGTNQTASVRWNTTAAPGTYGIPQLPYGTHKIKWIVSNGMGTEAICEYLFTVRDCKKPTIVCLNGLSVNIMPTSMVTLWASDFLQYTEDNHTPTGQLVLGIRKAGTGTGFPSNPDGSPQLSVTYTCNELGANLVAAGINNTSFSIYNSLTATYIITDAWSVTLQLALLNAFTYNSYPKDEFAADAAKGGRGQSDTMYGTIDVSYQPFEHVGFSVGVSSVQPPKTANNESFRFPFFDFVSEANNYTYYYLDVYATF